MYDEPDVVKMLREAEKLGTLQSSLPSPSEEFEVQESSSEDAPYESDDFAEGAVKTNTIDKDLSSSSTEKEKITVALEESEERYKALFNGSFELIYLHDFKGNFIDANPVAFKLLGYDKEELTSINFSSLLDKGQFWKAIKTIKEIKKYGRQKKPTEFRLKTKNGTFVDIETTAEMVYRNGKPYAIQGIAHDITERKNAEATLKESQEKYKRLFDSSPDLIIETDEKGNMLAINPMMAKSMGAPSEKLIGKNIFDIFPKEIAEQRAKIARKAFEEMKNQESEDERTGRYFHNIYVPIVHPDGTKTIQTIVRDITDQKTAERALCNSEGKLRSIVENSSDQIFMLDKDCKFLSINKTAAVLSGKSPQETIGMSISEIFPENIAVQFSKNIKKVFDTGKSLFMEEKMVVQGRELYNSTSLNPIKDDGGRVIAVTGIVRDVTERKQMEMKLCESEVKYRYVVEHANDGIVMIQGRKLVFANETFAKMLGYTVTELEGMDFLAIVTKEKHADIADRVRRRLAGENVPPSYELELVRKDGVVFNVEVNAGIVEYQNAPTDLVIIRDITERKRAEEEIRYLKDYNENILESNPNPIMVVKGTQIEYVNKSFVSIFGETKSEYIAGDIKDVVPSEILPVFENLLQKDGRSKELKFRGKDFSVYSFVIKKAEEEEEEGKRLGIILQDISERKKAEEVLKEKIEELERYKKLTVDRELKMMELKKETNELCIKLGEKQKYTM
jgi:PAS domain S-box-containing protein